MNFTLPKAKKAGAIGKDTAASSVFAQQHDLDTDHEEEGERKKEACLRLLDQGSQLAEAGLFEEAARMFLVAVDFDPMNSQAFEMLAQVYLEMDMTFQAVKHAERSHAIAPTWPDALHTLARCQREYGEIALSLQSYDQLLIMQPDNQIIHNERLEVLALCTEFERRQSLQLVTVNQAQNAEEQEVRRCLHNLCSRCQVVKQTHREEQETSAIQHMNVDS